MLEAATHTFRGASELFLFDAAQPAVGHRTWNQIARLGSYKGHPQGQFAFTAEVFDQLIANFESTENRAVPVDYEHTSEVMPETVALTGVPALAFIVAIERRGDALWGEFEWVDAQAVEYVRAGRYRYLSPAVSFDAIDKVSGSRIGARLTSAALTNHPFLDGMAPLTASERSDDTARMGLAPGDVHIPAGVNAPQVEKPAMEDDNAQAAQMSDELAAAKKMGDRYGAMKAKLAPMAESLGMAMDSEAAEDALLEKLAAVVAELQQVQRAEAASMADRVIGEGRALEGGKGELIAFALRDRKGFVAIFGEGQKVEPKADANASPPKGIDAALLTERVAPAAINPLPEVSDEGAEVLTDARKLLSEGKAASLTDALIIASRASKDAKVKSHLNSLRTPAQG